MVFYLSPLKPQMGAPGESGNASHLATFSGEVTDRTAPPPSLNFGEEKKKRNGIVGVPFPISGC